MDKSFILSASTSFFLAFAISHAADSAIPEARNPSRYERLWTKNPFTVASVIAPTNTTEPGFADSFTLSGLAVIGGKALVTIVDNSSQQSRLITSTADAEGISVVSFVNNLDPSKVEVVIKKGDQTGTMHFAITNPAPSPDGIQPPESGVPTPLQTMPSAAQPRIQPPVQAGQPPQPTNYRRRRIALPGADRRVRPPNRNGMIPPPTPR